MVYPSHWAPGEYGVADPNAQPYDIVQRSLEDFQKDVRGTGARVVPWLQDFSLGVRLRAGAGRGRDPGAPRRGHRRVPALGSGGHVHRGRAAHGRAHGGLPEAADAGGASRRALKPNELGLVPVLMHHQIRRDGSVYDMTAGQLRSELTRLWQDGFYPIARGRPRLRPARRAEGEDARRADLRRRDEQPGRVPARRQRRPEDGGSACSRRSRRTHPDFPAAGTFYVPRNAFDGDGGTPASTLRWLVGHGFELGNHTKDHIPLNTLDAAAVQRQLVLGNRVLTDLLPGYRAQTMALPLGALPHPASLAVKGTLGRPVVPFAGVFLAGAEPAPSPFSTKWNPARSRASGRTRAGTARATSPRGCGSTSWSGTRRSATSRTGTRRRSRSRAAASRSSRRSTGARKALLIGRGASSRRQAGDAAPARCRRRQPTPERRDRASTGSQPRAWKSASASRSSTTAEIGGVGGLRPRVGEKSARGVAERDGVGAAGVRVGRRGRDRRRRVVAVGGQRDGRACPTSRSPRGRAAPATAQNRT